MDVKAKSIVEKHARRLKDDPGSFEPTTGFRVAQRLSGDGDLSISSHSGARPAPLAIGGFRRRNEQGELTAAFAPMVGPLGSLPPSYNELLQREDRNRSKALASFFDLFASRFAELFVSATEKYRLARRLRWAKANEDNTFRSTLLALTGFRTAGLCERAGVSEDVLLRFSGFFADRTRNAQNLTAMVAEFTGLPVAVEQFRRRWVMLPQKERSELGGGLRLGVNATAGAAVEDFSGGFRIVVGPVGYDDYLALTPGSSRLAEIFALTRLFVGSAYDFDVQIVLRKEDIPFCQLGGDSAKPRLGWNSWARTAPAAKDSGDAIISERQALTVSA